MKTLWRKKTRGNHIAGIVGGAVALLGTLAVVRNWHDLRRYLSIRRM